MQIGEYEIGEKLGEGGMSEVYAATHVRLGSRHALKLFTYPKEGAGEVRARFEQEGRLLACLRHPRVVRVTDYGADAATGKPYFVMDLVTAPDQSTRSLADVQSGEADEETIARWYDDLREGLAYIHARGIIHRDLKLENVLIGPDGHVVLTDFGISRVLPEGVGHDTVIDPVRTLVRMKDGKAPLMGSIGYMAPELELGAAATVKSDWYALGVIIYRLLTGTWCDARTDVLGTLATYDPVWACIIPKLLHANPEGRACLSFAELKARAFEEQTYGSEQHEEMLKRRLKRSLFAVIGLSAVSLVCIMWALSCRPAFSDLFSCPGEMPPSSFHRGVSGLLDDEDFFRLFYDYSRAGSGKDGLIKLLEEKIGESPQDDDEEGRVARHLRNYLKGAFR